MVSPTCRALLRHPDCRSASSYTPCCLDAEHLEYFQPQPATIVDHRNGTYDLFFVLTRSGSHLAAVNALPIGALRPEEQATMFEQGRGPEPNALTPTTLEEVCAPGEDWRALPTLSVTVGPSSTSAAQSSVDGAGLVGGIAGLNISFSIYARDEFGNTQAPGLDEGESFNVLVEYRTGYQTTWRTVQTMELGAGDNDLDVFTFTMDADYDSLGPHNSPQMARFMLSFQEELAALAGIDEPSKVSIISVVAASPNIGPDGVTQVPICGTWQATLVEYCDPPAIYVNFRLDLTAEESGVALATLKSLFYEAEENTRYEYRQGANGTAPVRLGSLVEDCIPIYPQDGVVINECKAAVLDDQDDDISRTRCESVRPPADHVNFLVQICNYQPALTTEDTTAPHTTLSYKYVDSEWVTDFFQVIYGNLTIPGFIAAWDPQSLEGRNAQEQLKLGIKETFTSLSGGQLFRQKVYVENVVDPRPCAATDDGCGPEHGDSIVTVYYKVTSTQDMAFVLDDEFMFVMQVYTQVNAKGQVVSFTLPQLSVHFPHTVLTDVEFNADAHHKYLPDSDGEYITSYRVPPIPADEIRWLRITTQYCEPGLECQTDTSATGGFLHESAVSIQGSPREAILLGSPNHLVANASMSSATGAGVEGKYEVGHRVEFLVQMRDFRGIDLVRGEQGSTDVDVSVEAPGLDIDMIDQRNGRFVGSYMTNTSRVYNITFKYTEKATRECVQIRDWDGECLLYDSIPGRTYIIADRPYEVLTYAQETTPSKCDAAIELTLEHERLECLAGRQVGAPPAFAAGPPNASNALYIGDALSAEACEELAMARPEVQNRQAFTVTYSANTCDCLFPFTYDGVEYSGCTTVGGIPEPGWCATSTKCQTRFTSEPNSICMLGLTNRQEGDYAPCADSTVSWEQQACPTGRHEPQCFLQLGREFENLTVANMTGWRSCKFRRNTYTETDTVPLQGMIAGIAGRPFEFFLTSRDSFGNTQNNPVYAQSDEYLVEFVSLNDTRAEVFQEITPEGNGVYRVSLTAQAIGKYAVTISLHGEPILNPNFLLDVQTSSVHPETSMLEGPGLVLFPVAQTTSFTAQLRDRFGNLAACTEATIETLRLVGLGNMTDLNFEARCSGQNSMTATYVTTVSGSYMLNVSAVNGSSSISPGLYGGQLWPAVVEPAPISAQKSSVFLATAGETMILPGSTVTAKLDLRDRFGNPTELRTSAAGVDLSSGLRVVWSNMGENDGDSFWLADPTGEIPPTQTTLVEVLDGEAPIHSKSVATVIPGGVRDSAGNYTTTFVPVAYGRYSVRAIVTVDCADDGTGVTPLEVRSQPRLSSCAPRMLGLLCVRSCQSVVNELTTAPHGMPTSRTGLTCLCTSTCVPLYVLLAVLCANGALMLRVLWCLCCWPAIQPDGDVRRRCHF